MVAWSSVGNCKIGKLWLDLESIFKVELIKVADRLDIVNEMKR